MFTLLRCHARQTSTAFSFALVRSRVAELGNAVVRHSMEQYLQSSSETQGSLESQAHCLDAPRSFLLEGNIGIRVTEALHTPELCPLHTCK